MSGYRDRIKVLRTDVQRMTNEAKTLYATLEAQGDKATADDRQKLATLIDEGKGKREELERLIELQAADDLVNAKTEGSSGEVQDRVLKTWDAMRNQKKSWGQRVIESPEFKAVQDEGKRGGQPRGMAPVQVRAAAIQSATEDAQGGHLVRPERLTEIIDIARQRPITLLDVVNQSETTVDAVEYIRMISRTIGATVVPELTGGTGTLKPQSDIQFDLQTAAVKTIAAWIVATRQILMDAPRLRDAIDNELIFELPYKLEDQIINGDGTGNNFTGILNTPGIQTRVMSGSSPSGRGQVTGDTRMTTLRRAVTDIVLEFYDVDGIALNPIDAEGIEIAEYTANRYMSIYDPVQMRLWRKPVVETQVLAAGTSIVGAWRLGATLWDRMATEIRVSENVNDQFIRNMVTILAELRAAFGVVRPKAFEKVTLV